MTRRSPLPYPPPHLPSPRLSSLPQVCAAAAGDAPPTPPLTPPSTLPPRRGRRPRNVEELPRPLPAALMSPGPRDASMLKHMLTVAGRQAAGGGAGTLEGRRSLGGGASQGPSGATLPGLHHHHLHLQQQQHLASAPPQQVLSVKVNGAAGGRHHPALNMSSLSSSKHSVGGNSGSGSPGTTTVTRTTGLDHSRDHSHLTDLSHISHLSPIPPADLSKVTLASKQRAAGLLPRFITLTRASSSRVALTSLGLLCLTSLLLALLALTFLVELTPLALDADSVQEVTLALAALTLSLDLSCLLICAAQFIFAIKLAKSPNGEER
ncbi:hypothetical protein E2C01_073992 [Portunus trituberculatus]|uniref:Uncharacterized protein n=1 Tax=Portunus trituberculatus TaxID=210409 RepID=A0A5B7IAZ7_PORTR|nr:hypothetical protein [Portunus trituberculatus]